MHHTGTGFRIQNGCLIYCTNHSLDSENGGEIQKQTIRGELGSRPFLLLLVQCQKGHVCHFDHFESDTGNVPDGVTLSTESGDQHFIILLDVVEAAVVRYEGRDLLSCVVRGTK